MAAKKRLVKKAAAKAAAGKKSGKKVVRKAETFLGRIAQRSAQLVLASGVLGELPTNQRATKKKSKAR